jgi:hypothetical protein
VGEKVIRRGLWMGTVYAVQSDGVLVDWDHPRGPFFHGPYRPDELDIVGPADGYAKAKFLRDTPFSTVREWRQATIGAIPEAERCPKCSGSGADVILASNGGVGEIVNCWPCEGTGRKKARAA